MSRSQAQRLSSAVTAGRSSSGESTRFFGVRGVLDDVDLPPIPRGRPTTSQREQWLQVCEIAMARGVRRPGAFARMTGVTPKTARRWMREVDARWSDAAEKDAVNLRREILYREAVAVAEEAWAVVRAGKHPGWVLGAMRVVLESIRRRSRLCGIDGHPVALAASKDAVPGLALDELQPDALVAAGRAAALLAASPPYHDSA